MFPSVEFLHSTSCSCLMPRYAGSGRRWPLGLVMYPIARIKFGLWWVDLWCGGRNYSSNVCGWLGMSILSLGRPSSSERGICGSFGVVVASMSGLMFVKSMVGLLPR